MNSGGADVVAISLSVYSVKERCSVHARSMIHEESIQDSRQSCRGYRFRFAIAA